jgi:hypothetical protein
MEPPRDLIMPADLQYGSLVFSGVVFAIVVSIALWQVIVRREPLLLFCVFGGIAAVLVEPVCDVIGMIYHPEIGQITAFEAIGRKIPWHVVLLLSWYYALFAWLLAGSVGKKMTRRGFWKLFFGLVVFSTVLEISPTQQGLWKYYGEQPFTISGMPLWWFVANAVSALAGGTLATIATRASTGWARWQVAFLMPVGIAGAHLGVALPTYIAMNMGWTGWCIQLAGVVTVIYSLVLMQACARLLFPDSATQQAR